MSKDLVLDRSSVSAAEQTADPTSTLADHPSPWGGTIEIEVLEILEM
ncbi:hypothetical protein LG299_12635 [Microbacterium lacus]